MLVDGCNCKNGVLSDVSMSMFQTGSCRRKKGFDQLRLAEFTKEAEGVSPDVFVGMLEIISDTVAGILVSQNLLIGNEVVYQTRIISCFSLPFESSLGQSS